jgi:uroporphyrin-III C-methyltransferase/precorrin-2 dehydrogenase/sirohydrochlorin ferrochelatase
MGLTGLPIICKELIANGLDASTPIALIENATRANQKVVTGTLEDILDNPLTAEVKPPTLIIVGTVVTLHGQLNWFSAQQA